MKPLTLGDLARLADAALEGDAAALIHGVAPLEEAGPGDLSFVAEARYHPYIQRSRATAVLVARDAQLRLPEGMAALRVEDPRRALAGILAALHPEERPEPGVHPTAVLGAGVTVAPTAQVGPYAVLGEGTTVGERARIGAHAVLGRRCRVADDAVIHAQATLYDDVQVGERSIVHSGARLGADGFGYVWDGAGHRRVPQVGGCRLGSDVEIGANTTVDRGSIGDTVVGDGTKIDNLVQIGHNCRIGRHVIIISQVGISGSTRVGDGAVLAGQAGVQGHIEIGAGARVGGQAGVTASVAAGETVSGYPARPHREALRVQAAMMKLPELVRRVKELERALLGR